MTGLPDRLDVPHTPARFRDVLLLRVRALVLRYLRRYGDRLVQAGQRWSDVAVGPEEFRRAAGLAAGPAPIALVETLGVPPLQALDRTLESTRRALDAAPLESPDVLFSAAVVAERFDLDPIERDLLICAAAPRADHDIARLFSFAWADFTLRQPSGAFLAELVASHPDQVPATLRLLDDDASLVRSRLLIPGEHERWRPITPRAHAPIAVAERVVNAIFGDMAGPSMPGAWLVESGLQEELVLDAGVRRSLERLLAEPTPRFVIEGQRGAGRRTALAGLICVDGTGRLLVVDLPDAWRARPAHERSVMELVADVLREARLLDATLLVRIDEPADGALEGLVEAVASRSRALRTLVDAHPGAVAVGSDGSKSGKTVARHLFGDVARVQLDPPPPDGQRVLWNRALGGQVDLVRAAPVIEQLSTSFSLTPGAIRRAVEVAVDTHRRAGAEGDVPAALLVDTVQRRMTHRLGWLADTLVVDMTIDEVVFPDEVREQIDEVMLFAEHAYTVMHDWGLGGKSHSGFGLSVLFSGPPGTGKTLTAAVIGRELGRLVYRVDLSTVVDKYIGETEKNLGRVFDEADRAQAVLLFDEADSLFAKRTSVKSSNDRYANLEVNYLLQRLEAYSGMVILTTNFATSIDEAFQRRIRFKVEFTKPDSDSRAKLWETLMPAGAPLEEEIDWDYLAADFEFTGGHIRNAIMRGCIRAADLEQGLDTDILYEAAMAESRELGLLVRDY